MILYSLKCAKGHVFESWFRDSAAFDALAAANRVACAVCGDSRIEKAIMAPAVGGQESAVRAGQEGPGSAGREGAGSAGREGAGSAGREGAAPAGPSADRPVPMLSGPASPVERALTQLRRFLADKADYVGRGFADEARRIHLGEADERAIWGETSADEAKALEDEGVPVAPLPLLPRRDD